MLLVAARSLHQDPLMVSLMPPFGAFRLQRPAIFRVRQAIRMFGAGDGPGGIAELKRLGR
jgi:hypothetical protein